MEGRRWRAKRPSLGLAKRIAEQLSLTLCEYFKGVFIGILGMGFVFIDIHFIQWYREEEKKQQKGNLHSRLLFFLVFRS